jgi:hypothetical protein
MTKEEIALQLTLALIQRECYYSGTDNNSTGKNAAELFNTIYQNVTHSDDDK